MMKTESKTKSPGSREDRELLEKLYDVINGEERPVLLGREGAHVQFPEPVFHLLTEIVRKMHRGQSVVLLPENEELTTQAAANQLGASRPHVVKLLEEGAMPYHMVGSHRRIYLRDLLSYQKQRDRDRREAMDALNEELLEADLYDSDYTGEG
ncbi:MAG: excisionase family DNA-binding protein [Kiritimatiellae bacterium]|nr:excisionase family DNA-binding protein [Kiritimatiellia bacterium]